VHRAVARAVLIRWFRPGSADERALDAQHMYNVSRMGPGQVNVNECDS